MGDGRLREAEQRNEFIHAHLACMLSQHVDHLQPDRITKPFRDGCHPHGFVAFDLGIDDGLAAWPTRRALRLRSQFQINAHAFVDTN